MTRPPKSDPISSELLRYFEEGPSTTDQHYFDLPRAMVVTAIPEHRPHADFVTLPKQPLERLGLMEEFLSRRGIDPSQLAPNELKRLVKTEASGEFEEFRGQVARRRMREWLEEHGVIFTG